MLNGIGEISTLSNILYLRKNGHRNQTAVRLRAHLVAHLCCCCYCVIDERCPCSIERRSSLKAYYNHSAIIVIVTTLWFSTTTSTLSLSYTYIVTTRLCRNLDSSTGINWIYSIFTFEKLVRVLNLHICIVVKCMLNNMCAHTYLYFFFTQAKLGLLSSAKKLFLKRERGNKIDYSWWLVVNN